MTDGGGNLRFPASDTSCVGAYGDPKLGALQNNSGPVETMALGASSVALEAGSDAICNSAPVNAHDARGLARPQGAHCDIGAFEAGPAADIEIGLNENPDPVALAGNLTYTISIKNNGPTAAQNVVVNETVPLNTTFQSLTAAGWNCSTPPVDGTGTVNCSTSALANGQQETLALVVKVAQNLPPATTLENSTTVGSDTPDLGPKPNSAATTTCVGIPPVPTLLAPKKNANIKSRQATMQWTGVPCARTYNLTIRQGSKHGAPFKSLSGLLEPTYKVKGLVSGKTYYWYSEACNPLGCAKSLWSKFVVQ